jgi:hypothetical protein
MSGDSEKRRSEGLSSQKGQQPVTRGVIKVELHGRIPRIRLLVMLYITVSLVLCMAGCAPFPGNTNLPGTATPNMVSANMAVLGGSQGAFTQKFGQPHLQYIYAFTTANGERVVLTLGTLHNLATNSIRVQTIILEPDDNKMWDTATAQTLYQAFFPPDARFAHDGAGANGTYRFYTSALLANTFPTQAFMDSAGQQPPPGTFEVVCNNKIMPSEGDANGCGLMLGEWPHN